MTPLTIVKIGGHALDDAALRADVLDAFARMQGDRILVHGGGVETERLAARLGIRQTVVDGRRVTDDDTLRIAVMVYAGTLNRGLVADLQARGCNAIGLSGADANVLPAHRRAPGAIDFGHVGDPDPALVNAGALETLLSAGMVPVLCAITHDGRGGLLNTNADVVASTLAVACSPRRDVTVLYCFEREGVLRDLSENGGVLSSLSRAQYAEFAARGIVSGGMLPKLDAAFAAVRGGARLVRIMRADALGAWADGVAEGGTRIVE